VEALKAATSNTNVALLLLDTSSDQSIARAAAEYAENYPSRPMYGLVNNAGVGFGFSLLDTVTTNTLDP
jgi:NAD(P)-dependent dehydrogenase (short-subunit alcohol dehydrogenase family)